MPTDPTTFPKTPAGYLDAWQAIATAWSVTIDSTRGLPAEVVTTRVDGQWSVSETLRHLIFATDSWVRRTILGIAEPYWPAGVPHDEAAGEDGIDVTTWGIDPAATPDFDEVTALHDQRLAEVKVVIEGLTSDELERVCAPNPAPGNPEDTQRRVGRCLDVWVNEEWAHHGYVIRDLDSLARTISER